MYSYMELYKIVKDFPNYHVYPDGRVFSCKSNKFLKPHKNQLGYHNVMLMDKSKSERKTRCVGIHRLVGECFIDNPENKPHIDHVDRDKSHNNQDNLRWATISENFLNKGHFRNNTTGYKNISHDKKRNIWIYSKTINGHLTQKCLKDLNKVLKFKEEFERANNLPILLD